MNAVSRSVLDTKVSAGCSDPTCTEDHEPMLYLHATCHIGAQLTATYDMRDGGLTLKCGHCDRKVLKVTVAQQV